MVVTAIKFDNKRKGFWALGSKAKKILTFGYNLMFYNARLNEWTTNVELGMNLCPSVEYVADNWTQ